MKACGLLGVALASIGLLLALFVWIFWNFIAPELDLDSGMIWVSRVADLLQILCIYGAVLLIGLGLMMRKA